MIAVVIVLVLLFGWLGNCWPDHSHRLRSEWRQEARESARRAREEAHRARDEARWEFRHAQREARRAFDDWERDR